MSHLRNGGGINGEIRCRRRWCVRPRIRRKRDRHKRFLRRIHRTGTRIHIHTPPVTRCLGRWIHHQAGGKRAIRVHGLRLASDRTSKSRRYRLQRAGGHHPRNTPIMGVLPMGFWRILARLPPLGKRRIHHKHPIGGTWRHGNGEPALVGLRIKPRTMNQ